MDFIIEGYKQNYLLLDV